MLTRWSWRQWFILLWQFLSFTSSSTVLAALLLLNYPSSSTVIITSRSSRTSTSSFAFLSSRSSSSSRFHGWNRNRFVLQEDHKKLFACTSENSDDNYHDATFVPNKTKKTNNNNNHSRRHVLGSTIAIVSSGIVSAATPQDAKNTVQAAPVVDDSIDSYYYRTFKQRFPTLFDPIVPGSTAYRRTQKRKISSKVWVIEQMLELGPLQTPLRCVVVQLNDETLWVHAPLAPTLEFFDLVESCGAAGTTSSSKVAHVVVPTYALEHKLYVKDALLAKWPNAQLWTCPGQFSFPFDNLPNELIWGKPPIQLKKSDLNYSSNEIIPSWMNEIQFETLEVGTFQLGLDQKTFYETTFFHKASKTLIVTDAIQQIPSCLEECSFEKLYNPETLLQISQRSTSDDLPSDTSDQRQIGYEKSILLISYFFPQHEDFNTPTVGVVTWSEGWHENFLALSDKLMVAPVVQTLLYPQNPSRVLDGVHRISTRFSEMTQIIPSHWEGPIPINSVEEFKQAYTFLISSDDKNKLNPKDLERGLTPIAKLLYGN